MSIAEKSRIRIISLLYRSIQIQASVYNAGDLGSSPGLGRFPGEGNGNPPQYYCLENPIDRGASQATVHGVAKSRTRLSDFTFFSFFPFVQMRGPAQGVIGGWVMLGLVLQWFPLCEFSLFDTPQCQFSGSLGSWSQCSHSKGSELDLWSGTKIPQVACYGIK